ncbi:hypothetical protein MUY14_26360 [Amycolatopsis sp. FBCC-B4732]|uniref:hypothetical protein n=1 Tax=Amycolatopsis sp. FBCC-B4732 TaxID=3079339 RepID=UPI001FF37915|nr:hypothetical protein [Amycolatopsis sp. FBCC-B4732]UOX85315.1 hypothetical protein MUY14_26360 [Amycolatopsis sp. FBCC-B4732]
MTIELMRPAAAAGQPDVPAHLATWDKPDCDWWCPGGHGIPGEDHFHSMYVDWHIVVAASGDWLQVGVHREEGEAHPHIFLHTNDSLDGAQDLTIREARRLIRALRKGVKIAKKRKWK